VCQGDHPQLAALEHVVDPALHRASRMIGHHPVQRGISADVDQRTFDGVGQILSLFIHREMIGRATGLVRGAVLHAGQPVCR
jgi:hypothetical protein